VSCKTLNPGCFVVFKLKQFITTFGLEQEYDIMKIIKIAILSITIIMYNERRYQALHTENTEMQCYTFTILHLRMCLVSLTLI